MAKNTTPQFIWYHKPFGRRVVSPEFPHFSISESCDAEHTDTLRRRELANLAGL